VPEPRKQQQWAVFAFIKDQRQNLWIGVNNLPYLVVSKPDNTYERVMVVPESMRTTGFSPRAMCFDQEGSLWVGFLHNLLVKVNPVTKETEQMLTKPVFRNELAFMRSFRRFKTMGKSKIWAGGTFGIACIDLHADSVCYSYKLENFAFYDFHFGNNNEWWIANMGTLKYFEDRKWKQDFTIFDNFYDISMILPGTDSLFWLPLYGGGLCKFNPVTHTYKTYTTANGLANNSVYCALKDRRGNLWLSTNKGISRFNIATEQFWNFDQYDGLTIEEFNGNSSCLAGDGEMIFGGVGGYVRFYPDSIRGKTSAGNSQVLISDVQVAGVSSHFDSAVYQKRNIIVAKGSQNITFHFTCTDLRDAGKLAFRYRLCGYDEAWNITDSKIRFANYVNLGPGEYRFEVQATDVTGEWAKEACLTVIIPALYYQTAFFRAGIAGLILVIIATVIWFYIYQIKLTERKKQEMVKLELLRSQLNPHFIFNALNPLNYMISSKDVMGANQYLSDFSRLLRLFLTNSRSEFIHIGLEAETIEKYLLIEQARFGHIFVYDLQLDPVLSDRLPEIAPAMVQPFLENSIIHGFRDKTPEKPGRLLILYESFNDPVNAARINRKATYRRG
jgi:streptogramin lyase